MAIQFAPERETTEGPLDVAHNGGVSDNEPPALENDVNAPDADETLDPNAPQTGPNNGPVADDEELLREKNPLGYTVTEPTEEEIDKG